MKNSKFKILCTKALHEKLDQNEITEFQKLLNASESNRSYFEHLQKTWGLFDTLDIPNEFNVATAWNDFKEECRVRTLKDHNLMQKQITFGYFIPVKKSLFSYLRPVRIAFALIVIFFVLILLHEKYSKYTPAEMITSTTTGRQVDSLILSDNSLVLLNANSSLQHPEKFSKQNRIVHLKGEAFFKVEKDTRPFIVVTENAKAKVLGTEFNIWTRRNETRVVVKSGRVQVCSLDSCLSPIILEKNFMGKIKGTKSLDTPLPVKTEQALAWTEGKFNFENMKLINIIPEIENFYDVKINFEDSIFTDKLVSIMSERGSLDQIISLICKKLNLIPQYISSNEILLCKKNEILKTEKLNEKIEQSNFEFRSPKLLNHVQTIYPEAAKKLGIQGLVSLLIQIDKSGCIQEVIITESSGSALLDASALEYCKKLKFSPAKRGTIPIGVWLEWKVDYKLVYSDTSYNEKNKTTIF